MGLQASFNGYVQAPTDCGNDVPCAPPQIREWTFYTINICVVLGTWYGVSDSAATDFEKKQEESETGFDYGLRSQLSGSSGSGIQYWLRWLLVLMRILGAAAGKNHDEL